MRYLDPLGSTHEQRRANPDLESDVQHKCGSTCIPKACKTMAQNHYKHPKKAIILHTVGVQVPITLTVALMKSLRASNLRRRCCDPSEGILEQTIDQ